MNLLAAARAGWHAAFHDTKPAAILVPHSHFFGEGEAYLRRGAFQVVWDVTGREGETASDSRVLAVAKQMAAAYRLLGDGWMTHFIYRRIEPPELQPLIFPARASDLVHAERIAASKAGRWMDTVARLYLTYVPPPEAAARGMARLTSTARGRSDTWPALIEAWRNTVNAFEDAMSAAVIMRRLNSAEMFEDLHRIIYGTNDPCPFPTVPVHLNEVLGRGYLLTGAEPQIGDLHFRPISIDEFPTETAPRMLNVLFTERGRMMVCIRTICRDAYTAKQNNEKIRSFWSKQRTTLWGHVAQAFGLNYRPNDDAADMVDDAREMVAEASAGIPYGETTITAVIIDEDPSRAKVRQREHVRLCRNHGLGARGEDFGAFDAVLSCIPGIGKRNPRRPMLSVANVAELQMPIGDWIGTPTIDSPLLENVASPLVCVGNRSHPFHYPFRIKGVGHTLGLGSLGKGKSTLLAIQAAAWLGVPDARAYILDLDGSSFVLAHCLSAKYYELAADNCAPLAPFAHLADPDGPQWLLGWLIRLFKRWDVALTPEQVSELTESLRLATEHPAMTMTEFGALVNDAQMRGVLEHYTSAGAWGHLFDGKRALLDHEDSRVTLYEMRGLVDLNIQAAGPARELIFHGIQSHLDGKPTQIWADEAHWTALDDISADEFFFMARRVRKLNAGITLWTQSHMEVVASKHRDGILQNFPIKLFCADSEADGTYVRTAYSQIGLSETEIDIIREAKSYQYFCKTPQGARAFSCNLGPVGKAICASTGAQDVNDARKILALGGNFLDNWLRFKGLGHLAETHAAQHPIQHVNGLIHDEGVPLQ
jgi:type IV secretion system protein VirB4